MAEILVLAVSSVAVATFRFFTAREFLKRANKKDIPAIARAMYPQLQLGQGRAADPEAGQPDGGGPSACEPDHGT